MLALTHLSTRYAGGEVRREARAAFPDTEVPRDFDTVEVPFPERGLASLIRWSERLAAAGEDARGAEAGVDGESDETAGALAGESFAEKTAAGQDAKRASSSIIQ